MRNKFEQELDELNRDLVRMGGMIETAISKAMQAIRDKDSQLAKEVVEADHEVDAMELAIERKSLHILLSEQPVARDLRAISTALKMITDMERICDQAADIAEIVIWFNGRDYVGNTTQLLQMARKCVVMVTRSIDAFVASDLELAHQIIEMDDEVDRMYIDLKNQIVEIIREEGENSEEAIDFLMIAKYLEKIGDHAENIADWVVFNITGEHKHQRIL